MTGVAGMTKDTTTMSMAKKAVADAVDGAAIIVIARTAQTMKEEINPALTKRRVHLRTPWTPTCPTPTKLPPKTQSIRLLHTDETLAPVVAIAMVVVAAAMAEEHGNAAEACTEDDNALEEAATALTSQP